MSLIPSRRTSLGRAGRPVVPKPRFTEASEGISNLVSRSLQEHRNFEKVSPEDTQFKPAGQQPELQPNPTEELAKNSVIPKEIFEWMRGEKTVPPSQLAKMMADISNKMGYYIAYVIMQRMTNLNGLLGQLHRVEDKLLIDRNIDGLSDAQLFTHHTRLKNTVNDFLEFARRFSVEAKEIIIDPERDELVNLVRSLDEEGLKAVKEMLGQVKKARTGSSVGSSKNGVRVEDFEKGQGKL